MSVFWGLGTLENLPLGFLPMGMWRWFGSINQMEISCLLSSAVLGTFHSEALIDTHWLSFLVFRSVSQEGSPRPQLHLRSRRMKTLQNFMPQIPVTRELWQTTFNFIIPPWRLIIKWCFIRSVAELSWCVLPCCLQFSVPSALWVWIMAILSILFSNFPTTLICGISFVSYDPDLGAQRI